MTPARRNLYMFCLIQLLLLSCHTTKKEITPAILRTTDLSADQFGARPNDGADDSEAIQKAIQYAVQTHTSSVITFSPGVYDLHKGIVIANQSQPGEYFFITIHLKGHTPTFDGDQRIGATTVFRSSSHGFTMAIQKARNCVIENIAFEGNGPVYNSPKEIVESTTENWASGGNRINRFSPHCAIAIDPFISTTSLPDRYPDFVTNYQNKSSGGSSLLLIQGCSFRAFYIAIANNPSSGIQNGDNIRAEQCYVSNCHTFWSCGQTQSRDNQISNVLSLYNHTFVSGVEIGQQQGTPPFINNVNVAGFCKYVLNLRTGFSGVRMSDSYLESIWSLGIALTNSVSFDGCQIQFQAPNTDFYLAPFQLYNRTVATFDNCSLEYFSDCNYAMPFILVSDALSLRGGWVEGGIVMANGYSNAGGEELHNVTYDNVFLKCVHRIAGKNAYERPIENLSGELFLGGQSIKSNDHSVFTNTGNTYSIFDLGSVLVSKNTQAKNASFTFSNPELLQIGDNLVCDQIDTLTPYGLPNQIFSPAMGYIKEINGHQIIVAGVPDCLRSGPMRIYTVGLPRFIPPIWGSVTTGSPIIRDIQAFSGTFYPLPGMRIQLPQFPSGAYVVESNKQAHTIRMSAPALINATNTLIKDAGYIQDVNLDSWNPDQQPVLIEGARINLKIPFNTGFHFINSSKAIANSSFKPALKKVEAE